MQHPKQLLGKVFHKHAVVPLLCLLLFAGTGTYLLMASHAATPYVASEPEVGTPTTGARAVTDASASAGKAISFSAPSTSGFVHPGIGMSRSQLDFIKTKVAAGQEPWKTAFTRLQTAGTARDGQKYYSLSYTAHPVDVVKCATAGGKTYIAAHPEKPELAEQGCFAQTDDAISAYAHALQWYVTGNPAHAQKAIQILNAWANTLTTIWFDQPRQGGTTGAFIYGNGKLQAAWTGETITKAAEIVRHTYTPAAGQETLNVPKFSAMLTNVLLPLTIDNWTDCCSNWQTSTTDATIGIGVFTENKAVFDNGIGDWRGQIPAAMYMEGDTSRWPQLAGYPIPVPASNYDRASVTPTSISNYWQNPGRFVSGVQAETCRDSGHFVMGMEATSNGAETARIQGINLYEEESLRIRTSLEFNAKLILEANLPANISADKTTGNIPSTAWLCGGKLKLPSQGLQLGWEQAYNHYVNRKGYALPYSRQIIDKIRPTSSGLHMNWQTLTKAENPM